MVLFIDSCVRCGGLSKSFLKHRYNLSLVSSKQRSSFYSVHFVEFYFFFFADRYGMGKCAYVLPNWHHICVSKNALLIHHISHKSQWTKPLNESTVSKIHIDTATESYLQRSSFDSVHFLEFYFFFFADRYRMGKCVRYVTCSYWETKTFRDWDIYTWPNDSSTHPWNKIDEHSPVHYLIPYHFLCWALASSKQRLSYVLPNWHRICVSKNALLIHHILNKSQWTKPLNEAIVSKIHIGRGTESHLQRSSFDSVHFLEFNFFFFANRYGMVESCFL